jgi:hypothetical protein
VRQRPPYELNLIRSTFALLKYSYLRISYESELDERLDPHFEFLSLSENSIQEQLTACGVVALSTTQAYR